MTPTTANSDKSLTSFPSFSPEASPDPTVESNFGASPVSLQISQTSRRSTKNSPSIVESLITTTPSFRGRSALFDDSPANSAKGLPGALHHASDDHIKRLLAKNGAINLVRQLAEDLAQRDAEMTSFRRRAEERERELKKMLREVEVSNLDIETRLHHIDNPPDGLTAERSATTVTNSDGRKPDGRTRIPSIKNGIDEMMGEAMNGDVGISAELDEDYLDTLDKHAAHATIKAVGAAFRDIDGKSTNSSIDSHGLAKATSRGWRDFLWSGTITSRKTSRASSITDGYEDTAETALRARASSGGNIRRKGLNEDLFQPPLRTVTSPTTREAEIALSRDNEATSRSRKSSTSISSWTIKLFAGNPQASRDPEGQNTIRGRSVTTGDGRPNDSRNTSKISAHTESSARAALMRVSSMTPEIRPSKKAVQPLSLGPNGTVKGSSQPSNATTPGSPASLSTSSNLGPVEMDTILPPESKPPTLNQARNNAHSKDLLTDRFGFIYDQRRKKKEADALASISGNRSKPIGGLEMLSSARDPMDTVDDHNERHFEVHAKSLPPVVRPETPTSMESRADEKPPKRWQDYLKVATSPAELLSHTPSSSAIITVASPNGKAAIKRSPTFGDKRGTMPSSSLKSQPSASSITADNAELAQASTSPTTNQSLHPKTEVEPVKMLLAQLTELHDSIQRDKTVKWNEFLRKVRAERKKEGETAASIDSRSMQVIMPEVTLTDGEMIGTAGLGNKGKVGQAKWKEFKQLVLAGIPVVYRAKVWAECSGASALRVPGYYDDLVSSAADDPIILAQIEMDIHRTLTDNVFFRKGPGVAKLHEVLVAYSRRNPEVGYCQGMNLIAGSLLLIMPSAEDAFWVLTSIIENILPRHYYDHSLLASRADQQVLRQYVTEILPRLSAHLDALGIELEALTFQWFLSVFTDCLSAEALFRVWDVVLCFNDGSTFLFQVALALLKLNEQQLLGFETPAGVYGYISQEMTNHAISIDGLIGASDGLKKVVRRAEVEERRWRAVEGERGGRLGVGSEDEGGGELELALQSPMPVEE